MGVKWAYYAGWTYWACHVVYISSKGTGGLRAMSGASLVILNDTTVYQQ